jgi:hypothetical protein
MRHSDEARTLLYNMKWGLQRHYSIYMKGIIRAAHIIHCIHVR